MGCSKSISKKEVYNKTKQNKKNHKKQNLPWKTRKISKNKQKSNLQLNQQENEQTKPKVSRRKEIIKIRAEIKVKKTIGSLMLYGRNWHYTVNQLYSNKKTMKRIYETKRWFFEKINRIDKPLAIFIRTKRERLNQ